MRRAARIAGLLVARFWVSLLIAALFALSCAPLLAAGALVPVQKFLAKHLERARG